MIKTEKEIRLILDLMEKIMNLEFKKYELEQEEKEKSIKERQELIEEISGVIGSYRDFMYFVESTKPRLE